VAHRSSFGSPEVPVNDPGKLVAGLEQKGAPGLEPLKMRGCRRRSQPRASGAR